MGSFRFRKSIKVGPGVRMNVSKRGMGLSAGTRGARYSVHSSGRRTASVGAPGTGLGYTSSRSGGRKRAASGRAAGSPPLNPPKPGLFAPKHEKQFHKALEAYAKGDTESAAAPDEGDSRPPVSTFAEVFAGAGGYAGAAVKRVRFRTEQPPENVRLHTANARRLHDASEVEPEP